MSVETVQGTNRKPVSSKTLIECISELTDLSGRLFIGYPIIGTPEGPHLVDALLVSRGKGFVVFDLIEGSNRGNYQERQDDSANKLEARLKTHSELIQRRDLLIPIHAISFAPGISAQEPSEDDYPLADSLSLKEKLEKFAWENPDEQIYNKALSAIESISTIRKSRTSRRIERENSRGGKLKRLEDSIATLDRMQSRAVIETVEGVQRIRGLAGSGKTIVLALKAAYLHAQWPQWRIAVTFNTRSLKGQFRRLINSFSIENTNEEPNWDQLRIINAWGAPGDGDRDGIYYEFCRTHDVAYFDFGSARGEFGKGKEFIGACEHALNQNRSSKQLYDAILIDEAQDFSPAFLRLCYEFLKEPKRLVYAYDELQSLSGESLPSLEDIFGRKYDGSPAVSFKNTDAQSPKHDIILEKCYRNSRPVLVTAHALGFGIYREPQRQTGTGLIQMFDHPKLWEKIGYRIESGSLGDGQNVELKRTLDTSPKFLEEHSPIEDLIRFIRFDSENDQANWLTDQIKYNLKNDELRHDDIVVINPDPLTTRDQSGLIRARLLDMGIDSHIAGVNTSPDVFFRTGKKSVTFTGIFRAKGNEAGMVYIINAQDCDSSSWNLASVRNRLFTAITRSKAWIRVLGVGQGMEKLEKEYNKLKAHNFELHFTYPTSEQREKLRIVHRDMTIKERSRIQGHQQSIVNLIKDIGAGNVHYEDLDEKTRIELEKIVAQNR